MIDAWPVNPQSVTRIGQGVLTDRGNGKPHKGVDIFVPGATPVLSPVRGTIIRVVDGREDKSESKRAAGLWIDLEEPARNIGENRRIHRFLHLGSSWVKDGQKVSVGDQLGVVAEANTSGLGADTHLHYEIRKTSGNEAYGNPIDPKFDLADAVATHAWKAIPKIVHIVGIERNGDPRYIRIAQAVRKVWDEKDPDQRMVLAHEADEISQAEGGRSFASAVKETIKKDMVDPVVSVGREALKEAGKEVSKGIGEWWDGLSTAWKIGVVGTGALATAAVVKSFIPR